MASIRIPSWRRLALLGAGTVAALTARLVMIRAGESRAAWQLARDFFSGKRPFAPDPVIGDTETWAEAFERRLRACETHLQNLPPERGM
jgi:hypothetical protein